MEFKETQRPWQGAGVFSAQWDDCTKVCHTNAPHHPRVERARTGAGGEREIAREERETAR